MLERSSIRWALGLAAVLVIGLAACTGNDSTPDRTTVEKVWTAAGIAPVSAVRAVGGVAVVYGTAGDDLVIYGLDPVTGTPLWSKPAALPTDRSDSIEVREIDGAVAYLRPTGTARVSQLVLADPTSGADLTVSAARYWYTLPARCDSDGWVCLLSYVQQANGHWDLRRFRVNRTTGDTAPDDVDDDADRYQLPIGQLFYTFPGDGTMHIGRRVDGAVAWTKPATDIWGPTMPKPWYFTTWDATGRGFAIMTTQGRGTDQPGGTQLDLAKDVASASVSLSDGAVRWSSPGTVVGCGADPYLGWDVTDENVGTIGYRCRYTGSAIRKFGALDGSQFTTTGLSVTVEAFDPETGDVRWATDVGDARALASDTTGEKTALLDDTHVVVANPAGRLVIDLQTGQSRPTAPEDVLWCTDESAFERPEPYFEESTPITSAKRSGVVHPCRPDGSAAPLPTAAIPSKLSASFEGDRRVIALSDGVAGFLVPPATAADGAGNADSAEPSTSTDSTANSTPASAVDANPESAPHAVEQAWAATGFEAKTTPELVGGTAVLYGTVGTQLFLIGLDPATGAERWRHPAAAGALSPRQEVKVVTLDDKVAYLRPVPDNDRMAQIAVIDPATGADVIVTEMQWWLGFPAVCFDDPATWCATAYYLEPNATTLTSRRFRIDRGTGALTLIPEAVAGPSEPYTVLWNDVVQINGATTDTIGIVRDGSVVWARPVTELAGAGATLQDWQMNEDDGTTPVLQLSVRTGWTGDGGRYPSLDLATNLVTVGINRTDGAVVWSKPGTWSGCRGTLWFRRTMSTPGSPDPALRCRYTGRLDSSPPNRGYDLIEATDLTVTLERVDLQTGEPIWSVPLGAERSLAVDAFGTTVSLLDDHRLLTGGKVVDLDDGSSRAPLGGETFWCPGRQSFDQPVEWMGTDGSIRRDRRVQGEVFQCDGTGTAASGTPSAVPLAVSTVTDDGLRLVSTPGGVVAYRVPL